MFGFATGSIFLLAILLLLFPIMFFRDWLRGGRWLRLAQNLNLNYIREKDDCLTLIPDFQMVSRPQGFRQVRNCLEGNIDGLDVKIFDYFFTLESRKQKVDFHDLPNSTFEQTVCLLHLPKLNLPHIALWPIHSESGDWSRVYTKNKLSIKSVNEFLEHYHTQLDSSLAKEMLAFDLQAWFRKNWRHTIYVEGKGQYLLIHTGKKISRNQVTTLLRLSFSLQQFWNPQRIVSNYNLSSKKDMVSCLSCKSEFEKSQMFCPHCGKPFYVTEEVESLLKWNVWKKVALVLTLGWLLSIALYIIISGNEMVTPIMLGIFGAPAIYSTCYWLREKLSSLFMLI